MANPVPSPTRSYARRLFERWFIEFNPLYLVSAALVLTGCTLLLRALASDEGDWATFAIALLSDAYAFALVGGAALLVRIGLRRPATMLALLFVLYQWDLTLFTETSALHRVAGLAQAAVWLAVFAAKIPALAWALRLRFAPRVVAAWTLAGLGLACGPHVLPGLDARSAGAIVATWAFALGALYRRGGVESLADLGPWGQKVLARSLRAAWALSGGLVAAHVIFWASDHAIDLAATVLVTPLFVVRAVRSEGRAWALVAGTLLCVAMVHPGAFAIASLLASAAMVLRAFAPAFTSDPASSVAEAPIAEPPYRWAVAAEGATAVPVAAAVVPSVAIVDAAARGRAIVGAVFGVYVAAWSAPWTGGQWPAHVVPFDVAMTALVVLTAWRLRVRRAWAPLLANYTHFAFAAGIVALPRTITQWGGTSVALGFALLAGSLVASYRVQRNAVDRVPARAR
jgi:hypothetical protein